MVTAISTVTEIESALAKLPLVTQCEVAAWLESILWPETSAMMASIDEAERSFGRRRRRGRRGCPQEPRPVDYRVILSRPALRDLGEIARYIVSGNLPVPFCKPYWKLRQGERAGLRKLRILTTNETRQWKDFLGAALFNGSSVERLRG